MNIITGYRDEPHVTEQQLRDTYIGTFGGGTYILNVGSKLAATVVSANEITIADGLLVAEGCTAAVTRGTSESLTIANGAQGMLRKDLIVARYTKTAGDGIEDMQLAVITGTPAASDPALPSYTDGSIADGDTLVEFPLYTVNLDGISIESVDLMVEYMKNTAELEALYGTLTTQMSALAGRATALEAKTNGFVGTRQFTVAGGGRTYIPLSPTSTYVVIINGYSTNNNHRGMYLIGSSASNALGIKAISAAADAELADGGTLGGTAGVLRIINKGSITMRVTIIMTTGTSA